MKKIILPLVFVLFLLSSCSEKIDEDTMKAMKLMDYHKKKFDNLPLSGKVVDGVREIEVKSIQYRWEPENIVVNKGEKLRFIVTTDDVAHGFELEGILIPGWEVDTPIKKGDSIVLEYTANEAGMWDMVCTVYCGPGHAGMKGKFIVRE